MNAQSHAAEVALHAKDMDDPLEILILDDMETDRMRLKRLCRRAGLTFRASEVSTISEMRRAMEATAFDVIFVDYALGIGTGLDAVKLVKSTSSQRNAIAIMVSTLSDLDLALNALRLGCSDYINKEELSVEAIRKSLAMAFERRLLMSSLEKALASETEMRETLERLARTSGMEICSVVAATLELARPKGAAAKGADLSELSASLQSLDLLCTELREHLDALATHGVLGAQSSLSDHSKKDDPQ